MLPHLGLSLAVGAAQVHELFARHARQVNGVIDRAIRDHAPLMRRRELPAGCLLCLVCGDAGDPVPVPPPDAAPAVGNCFERRGDYWAVRFNDGEQNIYKSHLGFSYLRVLLENPNRGFTPSELETRVRGARAARPTDAASQAVAAGELGSGAATEDTVADEEALESYRVRLAEIAEDLEALDGNSEPWAVLAADELTSERANIANHLRQTTGLRGRPRALGAGAREKVRKRVCAALTRARERIERYDTLLADHLKRPRLTLGSSITYAPPDGTVWLPLP